MRGITYLDGGDSEATERIALNLAPFAAAAALAAVVAPLGTTVDWGQYATALGLGVLAGLVRLTPWPRALGGRELLPSLIFLIAVAFLRSATGGTGSGIAVMAMLPVFWTALHGDRRQLCVVTAGVTLLFLGPLVFWGGRAYPQSQYRAGVLFVAVSTIIGFTTQKLVAAVRHKADESQAAMVTLIEQEAEAANERAELLSQLTSLANLSRWAFLLTFAGVGLRTSLRDLGKQGWRPFAVGAIGEIFIAILTLGLVYGADRFLHL